jgi:iron complex outermembrane receptor protein
VKKRLRWVILSLVAIPSGAVMTSTLPGSAKPDLTRLSLEELSNFQVTSVSKAPEKLQHAAAAIYVITQDAIHRSGATTIPEALRLAPGVEVQRINSNQWSIGVRGFTNRLTRSVLVLIDGRAVYSPLFAGTYWEVQDYLLDDVDRIEVIRGPGGTLWGANAVNGVINIITKNAKQTQGGLYTLGGGTEERGFTSMRYGGKFGEDANYRAYAKYSNRDASFHSSGDNFDDWQIGQSGFRTDWDPNTSDHVTVSGDAYEGKIGQKIAVTTYTPPNFLDNKEQDADVFGANVLSHWTRVYDSKSDMSLQAYYDRTNRTNANYREFRNTFDLDFQRRFPLPLHQEMTWGAAYRFTNNLTDASPALFFEPTGRVNTLVSVLLQDEFTLIENELFLTMGSKVEHNDYSGWETDPSGRLSWSPTENQTIWSAVSRAVRTPSQVDEDLQLTSPLSPATTTFARLLNNRGYESEKLLAYEVGYRVQPVQPVFIDISAFYNRHDDLQSIEPLPPFTETTPSPTHTIVPVVFGNQVKGETHGMELVSTWQAMKGWRLRGEYSLLLMHLKPMGGSGDTTSAKNANGSSPRHQVLLQSSMDLPYHLKWDPSVRYVDSLPALGVPAYWTLDMRFAWHATEGLELAIIGQNLLTDHHPEATKTQNIQRGVYGQATWQW